MMHDFIYRGTHPCGACLHAFQSSNFAITGVVLSITVLFQVDYRILGLVHCYSIPKWTMKLKNAIVRNLN